MSSLREAFKCFQNHWSAVVWCVLYVVFGLLCGVYVCMAHVHGVCVCVGVLGVGCGVWVAGCGVCGVVCVCVRACEFPVTKGWQVLISVSCGIGGEIHFSFRCMYAGGDGVYQVAVANEAPLDKIRKTYLL